MSMIYESPNQGKTVYARPSGSLDKQLVSQVQSLIDQAALLEEDKLWGNIRRKSLSDPELAQMLSQVVVWYTLKYS